MALQIRMARAVRTVRTVRLVKSVKRVEGSAVELQSWALELVLGALDQEN